MARIQWSRPEDRNFESGIDRGVLYLGDSRVIPWNGISSVDDSGESVAKELRLDGIKYLSTVSARDWKGTVKAYTYPDEFSSVLGVPEAADGLYIDSQSPDWFNLSYRTMVANEAAGSKKHYKIHLIYKAVASLGGFSYASLSSDGTDPTEFEFEIFSTPVRIEGFRPTSHIVIDTRKIPEELVNEIESILYGSETREPSFPDAYDLIDMLTFSDEVVVVYNGDGTWTATGSNANIRSLNNRGHFLIRNAPAEFLTDEVYEFYGVDSPAVMSIVLDSDGVPAIRWSEGSTNVGVDEDGTPFFETGQSNASIHYDTDRTPYFEFD